jgi:peroxiredoxin
MRNAARYLLPLVLLLPTGASAADAKGDKDAAPLSAGAYIREVGKLRVGDQVPRFKAKDIYGVEVCLDQDLQSSKKVVLTFWSMYCQACIEKFNATVAVQKKYEAQGLRVISVNTDGEYRKGEQTIRDFLAEYERKNAVKINFPVLYDETNWVAHAMRIEFLPSIISVDPQGRVHGFYQGFDEASEQEIQQGIEHLAQQLIAAFPGGGAGTGAPAAPGCPDDKK